MTVGIWLGPRVFGNLQSCTSRKHNCEGGQRPAILGQKFIEFSGQLASDAVGNPLANFAIFVIHFPRTLGPRVSFSVVLVLLVATAHPIEGAEVSDKMEENHRNQGSKQDKQQSRNDFFKRYCESTPQTILKVY